MVCTASSVPTRMTLQLCIAFNGMTYQWVTYGNEPSGNSSPSTTKVIDTSGSRIFSIFGNNCQLIDHWRCIQIASAAQLAEASKTYECGSCFLVLFSLPPGKHSEHAPVSTIDDVFIEVPNLPISVLKCKTHHISCLP